MNRSGSREFDKGDLVKAMFRPAKRAVAKSEISFFVFCFFALKVRYISDFKMKKIKVDRKL